MKLKTRVFELYNGKDMSLSELAKAMGISTAQVSRVRQGKRKVSGMFIIGAIKAFPGYKFDDLFYVAPDGSGNEGTTRDEVVKLRKAGVSDAEIGRRLGMSRERVRQIVEGNPTKPRKPALDSRAMLTTGDVAQLLGLHVNTVRRWRSKGILKSYCITPRGDRRFRREDIESFLKEAET